MRRLPETDRLEHQLLALGKRVQSQHIHRGFLTVLTMAGVVFLAFFAADYLTRFPYWLRLAVVAGAVGYGLWWFNRRALTPAARRLDSQEVSLLVERAEPGLQSRLISTLQWQEQQSVDAGTSENLITGMVDQTFDMIGQVRMGRIVDTSWRGSILRRLLLVALVITAVALLVPTYTKAFCQRLVLPNVAYPTLTRIERVDMPDLIAYGDPISVTVHGDGRLPDLGRIVVETDEGDWVEYDLHPEQIGGASYRADLAALSQPATMHIELGDDERGPIRLDPVPRPYLESITAVVDSPAYSGIEQRTEQTGNLRVLEGGTVDFTFTTSKVCPSFELVSTVDDDVDLPAPESVDGTIWHCRLPVTQSIGFTLSMTDELGLEGTDVPQYRITAIRDRPPVIRIEKPDGASEMAPVSRIPLAFTITDDLGIDNIRIEYVIDESEIEDSAFGLAVTREQSRRTYARYNDIDRSTYTVNDWWENSKTNVRPGQIIRFWIVVEDSAPTPHVTESDEQLIRVISSAEYRRVLWSKLGEHIERVDEMVPEIKDSNRQLEDVGEKLDN